MADDNINENTSAKIEDLKKALDKIAEEAEETMGVVTSTNSGEETPEPTAGEKEEAGKKTKEPVISFKNANIQNGESIVIYDLNMKIYPGDFVYIVGKVGTGKTSIIKTIIAENKLRHGSGHSCGYNLNGIKTKNVPYLRRKIGVVFQDFQLLMDRTVEDNLKFVLTATGWKDKSHIAKRIKKVLKAVGMNNKAHKMPHRLSGGEQQRIAIARALLNNPEVIIADEPTGNLDMETADEIMKLLTKINKEGTAIVMVTHNRGIFEKYPGRIMVCKNEECTERKNSDATNLSPKY